MIKKAVDFYYDPIKKFGNDSEMLTRQLAFLLGMIKKHKPKKIVEVGVAEGGTTVAIWNCLSMLNMKAEFFSLDLLDNLYRDDSKKTGHLIVKYNMKNDEMIKHTLYTGKYSVEYLKKIGPEIDFLILDTVHQLPGELLDFLAFLPFLRVGSVVVLHDTALNHYSSNIYGFATKVLFDTVTAEKILDMDDEDIAAGIGAFMINEDTVKYISDVFSALTITWEYMPGDGELKLYRDFYAQYYETDKLELFDMAVSLNQKTLLRKQSLNWKKCLNIHQWIEHMRNKKVYIYGSGNYGHQLSEMLQNVGDIEFGGYIISDGQKKNVSEEKIYYLSELKLNEENDIILIGVNISLQDAVCANLQEKGIKYLLPVRDIYDMLIWNKVKG